LDDTSTLTSRGSHVSSVSEIEVMNHLIDAHSRGYIDAREYDAADHARERRSKQ
jgi:hypothetical protein